ncbi:calcium/sodium antiporter [Flavobacterium sediminilitoris]|uniref:Calcium/sodium antiporter n=1 Tax=Flavobacterium sediminilitoris TaxID=2024526 RepID=A0ABY4HKR8_9FLAO|nr:MULTISPECIES: calcium/sodium antiporter [Flavobacterium]UOX32797.1 calcium/sodium antiporter [Flavobacterium sediminilitoris]
MNVLFIIVGLVLLVVGGNWLLKSSVGLSLRLNISKIIVGLTVVSFATSAPEMIVSVQAALDGFPDIALGNVIGSNIGNIGLVLGVVLLINTIQVDNSFYVTDWPTKMLASTLLFIFLIIDGGLTRIDGLIFIFVLAIFLIILIKKNKRVQVELEVSEEENMPYLKIIGFLALGGVALWGGSELLVKGAVNLAENVGVSKRVIAVTVVSIGTSIPELASSIIAAIKKENDISIGNIIGSNIFNILSVLGVTAIIKPIEKVDVRIVEQDIYWMLGFAFILLPLVIFPKRGSLSFKEGILLLIAYGTFLYFTVI